MSAAYVGTQWLSEHLDEDWLRVVDVRAGIPGPPASGPRLKADAPVRFVELGPKAGYAVTGSRAERAFPYEDAHIPGASFLDVAGRLFDGTGRLVWGPEIAVAMSEIGVGDEHMVVLVDDGVPTAAMAASWALRRYGHHETVVLAGGFPRWVAEQRPVTRAAPRRAAASFTARW